MEEKVCPFKHVVNILKSAWDWLDINCSKERCAWYDEDLKVCGVLSVAEQRKRKEEIYKVEK